MSKHPLKCWGFALEWIYKYLFPGGVTVANCNCTDKNDNKQMEEAIALLRYMVDHNKHHTDELYDVAGTLDGEAKELVHAAVIQYEQGNDKLEKALAKLKPAE